MHSLNSLVKIEDPTFYNNPYPTYARLRSEKPVYCYEPIRTWVLTKHADIQKAARNSTVFSNTGGIFLTDAIEGYSVADSYFGESGDLISSLDAPRHSEIKRIVAPAFAPKIIDNMEDDIRRFCRQLLDQVEANTTVDWISAVAEVLPLLVIAQFLGLEDANINDLARWSDEIMKLGQILSDEERASSIAAFSELNDYIQLQLDNKRKHPKDDVLSVLVQAEMDKDFINVANIMSLSAAVLAGGNETTRALLGNMMWALDKFPDQRKILAENPTLAASAIDETLRWKGPVHGFVRKVMEDIDFQGEPLRKGDYAYLLFEAANRDEDVFSDAESFIINRSHEQRHLAFGSGPHQCPGRRLARLEAIILLEEIIKRFPSWEISSPPQHIESLFRNGFYTLPLKLYS